MISRRTLLQSSPLALAGLATLIRPREAFAIRPIIPPPPTIDPTILEAHFTTGQNLQTSLFGSGRMRLLSAPTL